MFYLKNSNTDYLDALLDQFASERNMSVSSCFDLHISYS